MTQRLTFGDKLLIILSISILTFVILSAVGAEWCRNDYYCKDAHTEQYANDCAAHGFAIFLKTVWCWFEALRDDINAISTTILAFFTVILAFAARRQAILTRDAVETAAHHAKTAERALTDYERPWLFLEGGRVALRESQGFEKTPDYRRVLKPPIENDWMITLTFRNYGRMPALVGGCIFKISAQDALPAEPDYTQPGILTLPGTVGPNRRGKTNTVGPGPGRIGPLVFYGRVIYTELNGVEHHTGFALDVAPHMAAFTRRADAAYDYYD
jgi:hypothetical protein